MVFLALIPGPTVDFVIAGDDSSAGAKLFLEDVGYMQISPYSQIECDDGRFAEVHPGHISDQKIARDPELRACARWSWLRDSAGVDVHSDCANSELFRGGHDDSAIAAAQVK